MPNNSKYIVENIKDFNLDHIFDCGQCFRWNRRPDGSYTGTAFGRVVNMKVTGTPEGAGRDGSESLIITNCTEEDYQNIWRPYLDMDRDYSQIKSKLMADDSVMEKAIRYGSGIRILRQDLWETILSFIISQNNNIPRIKGCIEKLAAAFGPRAGSIEGRAVHSLPGPELLAGLTVEDLAEVRLGYRARYIIETARAVAEGGLPTNEEELRKLCGVGPKVANCIRLFGMAEYDSFPIDVWMRRVMNRLYGIPENDMKKMAEYAAENFAPYGGFAQQYLFYYIRETFGK